MQRPSLDVRLNGGQRTIYTACSATDEQLDATAEQLGARAERLDSFAVGMLCRHSKQLDTSCGFGARQQLHQVSVQQHVCCLMPSCQVFPQARLILFDMQSAYAV